MIQPLRRVHLFVAMTMTITLPAILVTALAVRHPELPSNPLPGDDMRHAPMVMQSANPWNHGRIVTRLRSDPASPGALFVELIPRKPFGAGEVLLYWSPDMPGPGAKPDGWRLLGLAGDASRCFALPPEVRRKGGHLVLYSLARHEVIAEAELVYLQ